MSEVSTRIRRPSQLGARPARKRRGHPFGPGEVLVDARAVAFDDGAEILRRQWTRGNAGRVVWTLQFVGTEPSCDCFLKRLTPLLVQDPAAVVKMWALARSILRDGPGEGPFEIDLVPIRGAWYTFIRDQRTSSGWVSGRAHSTADRAVAAAARRLSRGSALRRIPRRSPARSHFRQPLLSR